MNTSSFDFHKVGSTYYGWSQGKPAVQPPSGVISLIYRFSATNPAGPWTDLGNPTYYGTTAAEKVGNVTYQIGDPCLVEDGLGNTLLFYSLTLNGATQYINAAQATGLTLAQLVQTTEGVVNVPIPFSNVQLNLLATGDFTGADANPIGGNWTTCASTTHFVANQLVSNVVETTVIGQYGISYWNPITWPDNHWAKATIGTLVGTTFANAGAAARENKSGVASCYVFSWSGSTGNSGTWQIRKWLNNVLTDIALGTIKASVGDVLTIGVYGTQISGYLNGFLLGAPTDNGTASGSAGLMTAANPINDAVITAWTGGNFGYSLGGNVGVGGATVNYTGAATGSVTADANGNYILPTLPAGSYTITPSLTGYTFSPTDSAQVVSTANITGVNFTATPVSGGVSTQVGAFLVGI